MRLYARLLPRTLSGRVFLLFAVALAVPLLVAVALFLRREFTTGIEEALDAAQTVAEVVAPTITDSVVIGDYDTVRRTLAKLIQHSPFERASFIDTAGASVTVAGGRVPARGWIPAWLLQAVAERAPDINMIVRAGGKDYGVLRLAFATQPLAAQLASELALALGFTGATLLLGLFVIRVSLRVWLGPLERLQAGGGLTVEGAAAPIEIQRAVDAFRRREVEFQRQRITADATLTAVRDGVVSIDVHGRIVYVNPAAAQMVGRSETELLGGDASAVLPEVFAGQPGTDRLGAWASRVVAVGGAAETRVLDTSLEPVQDAGGRVLGHALTLHDVTERQHFETRLKAELELRRSAVRSLQDALDVLLPESRRGAIPGTGTDLQAIADLVADLLRQRESDQQAIDFQRFALDEHAAISIADEDGRIVYANPKLCELSGYALDELVGQRHNLMSSGQHPPEFFSELWDTIKRGVPWHGEIVDRRKDGSLFWVATTIVPELDEAGRVKRYIAIRTDVSAQRQIEQELAAARARELATGREIQRTLLIGALPEGILCAGIASYNQASRGIDGDFYAITKLRPGCFELLVGDVMGKGVPAALIGAAVRTTYSRVVTELMASAAGGELPPPAVIVNAMHRQLTARMIELETFVTLALYRFDHSQRRLRYVNAGHTPGLLVGSDAQVQRLLGPNLPLGVLDAETYTDLDLPLAAGDTLLAYSDGITEARGLDGEQFGDDRLGAVLVEAAASGAPASVALQAVRRSLTDHVGGAERVDDETAVLVRVDDSGAGLDPAVPARDISLPWALSDLGDLRAAVSEVGTQAGMDEDGVGRIALATFEAATNVIRHAPQPFEDATIECRILTDAAAVVVEIWYVGPAFTPPPDALPDMSGAAEGGFGLYVIRSMASHVAYAHPARGINCTRLSFRRDGVHGEKAA